MVRLALSSLVGVVVIGRNEGERLRRCLASLAPLGLAMVYVDSGSLDRSLELAAAMGAIGLALDPAIPFGAARARNEGFARLLAAHPNLEYVQFVDGDCEVEPGWIALAVQFLEANPRAAIACGRRRERFPEASFYNRLCDEEWNTPVGEAAACGGDFLARSDVFASLGGFNAALMAGEEPELCSRIRAGGWQVWRLDAAMTIHDAAMTSFRQWWMRAIRSGVGYGQAWQATAGQPRRLYRADLRRALVWAGAVPLAALAAAFVLGPAWLLLWPVAWGAQIARLSRAMGWRKAALLTVGKVAELYGAMIWLRRSPNRSAVVYK